MSRASSQGLSAATLAILAGLGTRVPPVTGGGEPATGQSKPVTNDIPLISDTYAIPVTGLPALPKRVGTSDTWEERAAIFEFEGGLSRPLAEAMAHRLLYVGRADSSGSAVSALDRELIEADLLRL